MGKKRRWIGKMIILFFILLLSMACVAIVGTDYFQIQYIEVHGNNEISEEEIVKLSGILKGDNILKLNKNLVKKRLENNPYIEVKKIERSYPNTVQIYILERKKGAVIPYLASNILIDTKGIVLAIESEGSIDDYPVITDLYVKSFVKGKQIIAGDDYQFRALLRVLQSIYDLGLENIVREIQMKNPDDIYIISNKNIRIKLGQAIDVDNKLKWLKTEQFKEIEPDLNSEWIFDISIPGKAIFSPTLD